MSLSVKEVGQIRPHHGKSPTALFFFYSTTLHATTTSQAYKPLFVFYCSLYYCGSKLNAQLQRSPSNINLAGTPASIINVCIAAEDSCIAQSQRITAPALSFLKLWQQGWGLAGVGEGSVGGGRGLYVEQWSRENILQPKPL